MSPFGRPVSEEAAAWGVEAGSFFVDFEADVTAHAQFYILPEIPFGFGMFELTGLALQQEDGRQLQLSLIESGGRLFSVVVDGNEVRAIEFTSPGGSQMLGVIPRPQDLDGVRTEIDDGTFTISVLDAKGEAELVWAAGGNAWNPAGSQIAVRLGQYRDRIGSGRVAFDQFRVCHADE